MPIYQPFAIRNVLSTMSGMQRDFLEYLLLDPKQNATKAAEQAGYAHPGKAGPRLRHHPKIINAIEEVLHQQTMSRNEVLARLSQHAAADYAQYIQKDGRIDLTAMKKDNNLHLIKHIKIIPVAGKDGESTTDEELEITFHDSQTALVWLGKHYAAFSDKSAKENETQDELSRALTEIATAYSLNL